MPALQWSAVPNSTLSGSAAQLANSISDWSSTRSTMNSFSGGYVNTVGDYDASGRWWPGPHFVTYGSGHVDYPGNERYWFGPWWDPNAQWNCSRPATGHSNLAQIHFGSLDLPVGSGGTGLDASGNPGGHHNYCGLVFVPTHNWLVIPGLLAGQSAGFTGSISGTVLTVTNLVVGGNPGSNIIATGQFPVGGTIAAGTQITGQLSGTAGGVGTYSVNISQTVASNQYTLVGASGASPDPNFSTTLVYDHTNPNPTGSQPWSTLATFTPDGAFHAADMASYDFPNHCIWIPAPINIVSTTGGVAGRSSKLYKYDLTQKPGNAGAYTASTASNWTFGYGGNGASPAYDEKRNILGLFCGNGGSGGAGTFQFLFFRTTDGINGVPWQPSFDATSTLPPTGVAQGAMLRDWRMDRFVVWLGGATLYFITAPTSGSPYSGGAQWHCQAFTPTGGATPPSEAPAGTYGKFAYMDCPQNPAYVAATLPVNPLYAFRPM